MRKLRECKLVTNGAGSSGSGWVTAEAESGHTYAGAIITRKAGTIAIGNIPTVQVVGDGDPFQDLSGQELDEENKADGLEAYDGTTLYVPFVLETAKDLSPSLGMAIKVAKGGGKDSVDRLQVKLQLSGASSPDLRVHFIEVEESGVVPEVFMVLRRKQYQEQVPVGEYTTSKFGYGDDDKGGKLRFWAKLLLKLASGNIEYVTIERNGVKVFDAVPKTANDIALANAGKVPGSYYSYIVDMVKDGFGEYMDTKGLRNGDQAVSVTLKSDSAVVLSSVLVSLGAK
jgi:hypothetical protein